MHKRYICLVLTLALCFSLIPAAAFAEGSTADSQLVAHWDFEGATAEEILSDKATAGSVTDSLTEYYPGKDTGAASPIKLENGSAVIPRDEGVYLAAANSADLNKFSEYTLFTRLSINGTPNGWADFVFKNGFIRLFINNTGDAGNGDYAIELRQNGNANYTVKLPSSFAICAGRMFSLAITVKQNASRQMTVTLHISTDGKTWSSTEPVTFEGAPTDYIGTSGSTTAGSIFALGKAASATAAPNRNLDFTMYDVRVYNAALSGLEIAQIPQASPNEETPPVLLADWRFNEAEGSVATDVVGNRQATLVNASFDKGIFESGVLLDAAENGRIDFGERGLTDILEGKTAYSISMWILPCYYDAKNSMRLLTIGADESGKALLDIHWSKNNASGRNGVSVMARSDYGENGTTYSQTYQLPESAVNIKDGTDNTFGVWQLLTVTVDLEAGACKAYINQDKLIDFSFTPSAAGFSSGSGTLVPDSIGFCTGAPSYMAFNGYVDEFRIVDGVLSARQLAAYATEYTDVNSPTADQKLVDALVDRLGDAAVLYDGGGNVLLNGFSVKADSSNYKNEVYFKDGSVYAPDAFVKQYFGIDPGTEPISQPASEDPITVACIGDSITWGTGLSNPETQAYPAQLQRALGEGYRVYNWGKPGATMSSTTAPVYQAKNWFAYSGLADTLEAEAAEVDVAFIMLGTNDGNSSIEQLATLFSENPDAFRADYEENLRRFVNTLRAANPHVVIYLMNAPKCYRTGNTWEDTLETLVRPLQQSLAEELNLEWYDMCSLTAENVQESGFPDKLHPGLRGHQTMAWALAELLSARYGTEMLPHADYGYVNITELCEAEGYGLYFNAVKRLAVILPPEVESFDVPSQVIGGYTNEQYLDRMVEFFNNPYQPEPQNDAEQTRAVVFRSEVDGQYVQSPSICNVDGVLYASCDIKESDCTHIFRSRDGGAAWEQVGTVDKYQCGSLFAYEGKLYLLGRYVGPAKNSIGICSAELRSEGALTWSEISTVYCDFIEKTAHCSTTPVLFANGRVYKAFEDGNIWGSEGSESGTRKAFVISCSLSADLLDGSNWVCSNYVTVTADWYKSVTGATVTAPIGVPALEGNVVQAPDGQIYNILRFNCEPAKGKAVMLKVSADGSTISIPEENSIVNFPGGENKFSIYYDASTGYYMSLVNNNTAPYWDMQRNVLSLSVSKDLINWEIVETVLVDRTMLNFDVSMATHAFQYVDWCLDGEDIVFTVRENMGDSGFYHNGYELTFYRLSDYKRFLPEAKTTESVNDYADNLIVYWDFEASTGGRLDDKATAGTYASNLTEKGTDTASVSYANGSVTIPKDAGVFLLSTYAKTDEINSAKEEMTVGARLNIDNIAEFKSGFLLAKANHFAFSISSYNATANTYKLQYRHESLNTAILTFNKNFECGKDYYIFVTVKLNSDKQTATAIAYWSEDGVNFTQDVSNTALTLSANAQANEGIIRASLNAAINLGTVSNKKDSAATYEVSFDDVWVFNAAVEADSLPVIVKNRFHHSDSEEKDAPAYRGCQISSAQSQVHNIRFVGTVDSLDYTRVGFQVQITDYQGEAYAPKEYWTATVYNQLLGNVDGQQITYTAAELGGAYIYALELKGVSTADQIVMQITVCCEALTGEVVLGDAYQITLKNGSVLSQIKLAE